MGEKYVYSEDDLSFDKVIVPTVKKKIIGNISYLNLIYGFMVLVVGGCLDVWMFGWMFGWMFE
jgi:hypothetical protein